MASSELTIHGEGAETLTSTRSSEKKENDQDD
jgi:hypothetical protein